MPPSFAGMVKSVILYKNACKGGDPRVIVAAYRALQPLFQNPAAYPTLTAEIASWTGQPVPTRLQSDVVLKTPRLLPWSIALCTSPPWPTSLPAHAIPVSVIELLYLKQAPEEARAALHEEIVKAWERSHLPTDVKDVLKWFDAPEQWEVISIRATPSGDALFSSVPGPTPSMMSGGSRPSGNESTGSASAPGAATSTSPVAGKSTGPTTRSRGSVARATSTGKGLTIGGSLFE